MKKTFYHIFLLLLFLSCTHPKEAFLRHWYSEYQYRSYDETHPIFAMGLNGDISCCRAVGGLQTVRFLFGTEEVIEYNLNLSEITESSYKDNTKTVRTEEGYLIHFEFLDNLYESQLITGPYKEGEKPPATVRYDMIARKDNIEIYDSIRDYRQ